MPECLEEDLPSGTFTSVYHCFQWFQCVDEWIYILWVHANAAAPRAPAVVDGSRLGKTVNSQPALLTLILHTELYLNIRVYYGPHHVYSS